MSDPGPFLREKRQLAAGEELLRGSVVSSRRRCGKATCACAEDDERRHPCLFLTVRLDGKTRTIHVRKEDEERVRKLVANYVDLMASVEESTRYHFAALTRQARDRRRKRAERAQ